MTKATGLGGDVAVEPGHAYRARRPGGHRLVRVRAVHHDRGAPYADVHEVSPPCEHEALASLAGGTCPLCLGHVASDDPFTVQLTFAGAAWRMPSWYEPA